MTSSFNFDASPVAPFVGAHKGLRFHRVKAGGKCADLRGGDYVLITPVDEFYREGMYVNISGGVAICQKLHSRTESGERQVRVRGENGYVDELITESAFNDEVAGYVVATLRVIDDEPIRALRGELANA